MSTSLTDVRGGRVVAATGADAASSRERRRSLQDVDGEIRKKTMPTAIIQKPNSCNEQASYNLLRRTNATTSLLRSVQRSPSKTCLLTNSTVLLVAAIAVTLLIGVVSWKKGRKLPPRADARGPPRVKLCRDEACGRIGALLKDALDDRVQPCDDFHAYVCGSWSHTHPGKSVAEVLASAFLSRVTRHARKNAHIPLKHAAGNQTAVQKAAKHLVACDNIVAVSDDQSTDVKRVLAEGGIAWRSDMKNGSPTDVLKAMFYMSQVVKIPVLLDASVEPSLDRRVVIRRPDNTQVLLGEMKSRLNDMASEKYDDYVRAVYDSFSGGENSSGFEVQNIVRLEFALVSSLGFSAGGSKEYKDSAWFTSTSSVHKISRAIPKDRWLKAFEVFLSIPEGRNTPVVVHTGSYFQILFALYEKLGEADFNELYAWLCIQALVPFTSRRIVLAQHMPAPNTVLQRHRWQCFKNAERVFHYALVYPYLADIVSETVRDDVAALMRRISRSFGKVVLRARPLSPNSKCTLNSDEILTGVHTEMFSRARPDYFEGYYADFPDMTPIAVTNWMRTAEFSPLSVTSGDTPGSVGDAAYVNYSRAWSRPLEASYLDAPWYSLRAPRAVKFAGLGSRLVSRLISELVPKRRACDKAFLAEVEGTIDCLATVHESHIRNFSAIIDDVRAAVLSWTVLWKALETHVGSRANATALEHFPRLSEPALFFVLGCLLTCVAHTHSEELANNDDPFRGT
nr:endothelin-converting enzyme 2-like [Dermacentor andersoni]